jgi:hypothetical protein
MRDRGDAGDAGQGDAGRRCGEMRDRRNSPKWMIGRSPAQRLIRAAVLIHLGIISSVPHPRILLSRILPSRILPQLYGPPASSSVYASL